MSDPVARTGGWKSAVSLKTSYQHADSETTLPVGESAYLRDASSTEGP